MILVSIWECSRPQYCEHITSKCPRLGRLKPETSSHPRHGILLDPESRGIEAVNDIERRE